MDFNYRTLGSCNQGNVYLEFFLFLSPFSLLAFLGWGGGVKEQVNVLSI